MTQDGRLRRAGNGCLCRRPVRIHVRGPGRRRDRDARRPAARAACRASRRRTARSWLPVRRIPSRRRRLPDRRLEEALSEARIRAAEAERCGEGQERPCRSPRRSSRCCWPRPCAPAWGTACCSDSIRSRMRPGRSASSRASSRNSRRSSSSSRRFRSSRTSSSACSTRARGFPKDGNDTSCRGRQRRRLPLLGRPQRDRRPTAPDLVSRLPTPCGTPSGPRTSSRSARRRS